MGKGKRIWLAALILATLGGIAWLLAGSRPPALIYKGQPLEFWLAGYDAGNYKAAHPNGPPPPTHEQADEAVRHIGSGAIPTFLRMLQMPDSKVMKEVFNLLQTQHFIHLPFIRGSRNLMALESFRALGPGASNAVPELIAIFDHDPSAFPQQAVPAILGDIGPAAKPAIPMLLRAVAHTNARVRNNAVYALGQIHAEPKTVVPLLIKSLSDPDAIVRMQAAGALGKFGVEARSAVPALLALEQKESLVPPPPMGAWFTVGTMVSPSWSSGFGGASGPKPDVAGVTKKALESIGNGTASEQVK